MVFRSVLGHLRWFMFVLYYPRSVCHRWQYEIVELLACVRSNFLFQIKSGSFTLSHIRHFAIELFNFLVKLVNRVKDILPLLLKAFSFFLCFVWTQWCWTCRWFVMAKDSLFKCFSCDTLASFKSHQFFLEWSFCASAGSDHFMKSCFVQFYWRKPCPY